MRTAVWPFASEVFDCSLFTGFPPLATGFSDLIGTDNDVRTPSDPTNRSYNSWGFSSHGTLELTAGGETRFHHVTRCVWDGQDLGTQKCTDRIHLVQG